MFQQKIIIISDIRDLKKTYINFKELPKLKNGVFF